MRKKRAVKILHSVVLVLVLLLMILLQGFNAKAVDQFQFNVSFKVGEYSAKLPYKYVEGKVQYYKSSESSFLVEGSRIFGQFDKITMTWPANDLILGVTADGEPVNIDSSSVPGSCILEDLVVRFDKNNDRIVNIEFEVKADDPRVVVDSPKQINISVLQDGQTYELPDGFLRTSYRRSGNTTAFDYKTPINLYNADRVTFIWTKTEAEIENDIIYSISVEGEPLGRITSPSETERKAEFRVEGIDKNGDNIIDVIVHVRSEEEKDIVLSSLEYHEETTVDVGSHIANNIHNYLPRDVKVVDETGSHFQFVNLDKENWTWVDEYHFDVVGDYVAVQKFDLPEGWVEGAVPSEARVTVHVVPERVNPDAGKFTVDSVSGYSQTITAKADSDAANQLMNTLYSQVVTVQDITNGESNQVKVTWSSGDGKVFAPNVPGKYLMKGHITLPLEWKWKSPEEEVVIETVLIVEGENGKEGQVIIPDDQIKVWISDEITNKIATWQFESGFQVFDELGNLHTGAYLKGTPYLLNRNFSIQYIVVDPNLGAKPGDIPKNFDDLYIVEVNGEQRDDVMRVEDDPSNKNPDGSYKNRCIFSFSLSDYADTDELNIVFKNRPQEEEPSEDPSEEPSEAEVDPTTSEETESEQNASEEDTNAPSEAESEKETDQVQRVLSDKDSGISVTVPDSIEAEKFILEVDSLATKILSYEMESIYDIHLFRIYKQQKEVVSTDENSTIRVQIPLASELIENGRLKEGYDFFYLGKTEEEMNPQAYPYQIKGQNLEFETTHFSLWGIGRVVEAGKAVDPEAGKTITKSPAGVADSSDSKDAQNVSAEQVKSNSNANLPAAGTQELAQDDEQTDGAYNFGGKSEEEKGQQASVSVNTANYIAASAEQLPSTLLPRTGEKSSYLPYTLICLAAVTLMIRQNLKKK